MSTLHPAFEDFVSQPHARSRPHSIALSIAGFDPSSGAGITADLKVFAAHDVYGVAAITALTVQSTKGVRKVEPVSPATFKEQIGCLQEDLRFDGIKLGMLADEAIVRVTAEFLRDYLAVFPGTPVVLDPVLCSSSGRELLSSAGAALLRERLLPLVSCVTPNLAELAVLSGRTSLGREEIAAAARSLQGEGGGPAVLVTGGHFDRPDDYLLTRSGAEHWLPGERVETTSDHGTGCAFSSALVCGLMRGQPMLEAATAAKAYVAGALRAAYPVGKGRGPMHHLSPGNQPEIETRLELKRQPLWSGAGS